MRKGFTLIELLVVIAIIAILAAILFPIFARARDAANRGKCLAHGREIGRAMQLYLDDYDGRFPSRATAEMLAPFANYIWEYDWPAKPGVETWGVGVLNSFKFIQLAKYTKSLDIWICPSPSGWYGLKYARGYRNSWFFITSKIGYGSNRTTYPDTPFQEWKELGHANDGIGRTITEGLSEDATKWHRSPSPSRKIFAFCYSLGPDIPVEAYSGGPLITPYYPHNGGSIYVYIDGHAKWHETGCGWAPVGYTTHRMDRPHPRI